MRPFYATWAGRTAPFAVLAAAILTLTPPAAAAQNYLPPLTDPQVDSVRAGLADFKESERGPYLRIRWFCKDGSIQPPQGQPCAELGGGNQHAELAARALRFGRLGLHVGTILQATSYDEFFDAPSANDRLKQIVLEHYLVAVDDGWVLRRARYYRGARQAEDEERAGTELLERLLSDTAWVARNYWLANQLVAAVPHIGVQGDQLVQNIRNLATEVAATEPAFAPVRVRIHSFPSSDDVDVVARWRRRPGVSERGAARLAELHAALKTYYDPVAQLGNLALLERRLGSDTAIARSVRTVRARIAAGSTSEALASLAVASSDIRRHVTSSTRGRANLRLLDLNLALQDQGVRLGVADAAATAETRRGVLARLDPLISLAFGAGLLSERERAAIADATDELAERDEIRAIEYRAQVAYLARVLDWGVRTVRSTMTPTLERYASVEPIAEAFPDAATRGSVLLPLSHVLGRLSADADDALGASHVVFGTAVRTGLRGLNPGLAIGRLDIASPGDLASLDRAGIFVLPETVSELRPVAGVLSLDAGNLLSHVQLLARNLGIPNASIANSVLPALVAKAGTQILFAVSPLGRVVVEDTARLDDAARRLVHAPAVAGPERFRLDGSRLRLDVVRPVPMAELRSEDSGVIVGPKAANLGQLASVFPDRVSAGLALPFGMFVQHLDRPWHDGRTPAEALSDAYEEAARMRNGGASEDDVDAFMFVELARMRMAIEELPWRPEMRDTIAAAIRTAFGDDLSAGIFVRSDTNVEDLPQFSGAGLNLTVPNQRSVDDILASIKRVWTSPFSDRAYLWRKQILDEQSAVYPSVLLLRTVASEHSGVLITSGLQFGGPDDLTIATAEGIGGAVDGEDAETITVRPDGGVRLLSQSKAPRRRILSKEGGVEPVPARRPETLLAPGELDQLMGIVETWKVRTPDRTPGRIWDMEFGVVDGRVWLFQVRPFIRFRSSQLLDRLSVLDEELMRNADLPVRLDGPR